jgi:hypothetical protein
MPTTAIESCPYRSLSQIARRIPSTKGDGAVHTATLTRWILRGVRVADGTVIKLEARKFPGGWKVTEEAVEHFLDRLTSAALGDDSKPESIRPSMARQKELARVDVELASCGF